MKKPAKSKLKAEPYVLRIRLPKDYMAKKPKDNVNHPAHYGGADNPYETIKIMEAKLTRAEFIGAMKFQVFKYNDRSLLKGNELEDYKKAQVYQNYLVGFVEKD